MNAIQLTQRQARRCVFIWSAKVYYGENEMFFQSFETAMVMQGGWASRKWFRAHGENNGVADLIQMTPASLGYPRSVLKTLPSKGKKHQTKNTQAAQRRLYFWVPNLWEWPPKKKSMVMLGGSVCQCVSESVSQWVSVSVCQCASESVCQWVSERVWVSVSQSLASSSEVDCCEGTDPLLFFWSRFLLFSLNIRMRFLRSSHKNPARQGTPLLFSSRARTRTCTHTNTRLHPRPCPHRCPHTHANTRKRTHNHTHKCPLHRPRKPARALYEPTPTHTPPRHWLNIRS